MAEQSSAHALHIVDVACSIAIIAAMSRSFIGIGRSIMRIIVLHISAQLMHIAEPDIPSIDVIEPAHIVHACSHAEHASIHRCIIAMSMPAIGPWADSLIMDIIRPVSSITRSHLPATRERQVASDHRAVTHDTIGAFGSSHKADRRCFRPSPRWTAGLLCVAAALFPLARLEKHTAEWAAARDSRPWGSGITRRPAG